MKISAKYERTLSGYIEWENTRTPASGTFQERSVSAPNISVSDTGLTAAEALCVWESTGKKSYVNASQEELLQRYIKGKQQRDWWTKEIGWLDKNGAYIPEEFMNYLHPFNFIELFGRSPLTHLVRNYHDNHYHLWQFRLDCWMISFIARHSMPYYERDDRHSAVMNAWRIITVKYVDPFVYRMRRKMRER